MVAYRDRPAAMRSVISQKMISPCAAATWHSARTVAGWGRRAGCRCRPERRRAGVGRWQSWLGPGRGGAARPGCRSGPRPFMRAPPGMAVGCWLAEWGLHGRFRQGNVPAPREHAAAGVLRPGGGVAAGAGGAHERPYACSALARVPGRLLACSLVMTSPPVVCPGVLPRWRGPDVGGPAPRGAHDAGCAPQLVTVRWLEMFPPVPGRDLGPRPPARVTAPFRSGPGPAGGCRRAGNRPATGPSAAGRLPSAAPPRW